MKVVAYEGLLEAASGIQSHISCLLANVLPGALQTREIFEDLSIRFSKLHDTILRMEADATEIDVDQGASVFVFTTEDGRGWDAAVEALRDTLAETIVGAGEYRLKKDAKFAALYGGLQRIKEAAAEYWEVTAELEEAEALAVLKAVCIERERDFIGCSDCVSQCTPEGCLYEDDIPHIDLDGHPLE